MAKLLVKLNENTDNLRKTTNINKPIPVPLLEKKIGKMEIIETIREITGGDPRAQVKNTLTTGRVMGIIIPGKIDMGTKKGYVNSGENNRLYGETFSLEVIQTKPPERYSSVIDDVKVCNSDLGQKKLGT